MNPLGAYFLGLATFPALLVVIGVTGLIAMNRAQRRASSTRTSGAVQSQSQTAHPAGGSDPGAAPAVPQGDGDSSEYRVWIKRRVRSRVVPVHALDPIDQMAFADAYIAHLDSIRRRALHDHKDDNGEVSGHD